MGEQIRVTPTLRVEAGPPRKLAVATVAMEPDRDAKGKATIAGQERRAALPDGTILAKHYKIGFSDALGKPITEGKEFTYLDYFGAEVWYFYQLEDVELEEVMLTRMSLTLSERTKTKLTVAGLTAEMIAEWFGVSTVWVTADPWRMKRFMPRSVHATKAAALAAADALKE